MAQRLPQIPSGSPHPGGAAAMSRHVPIPLIENAIWRLASCFLNVSLSLPKNFLSFFNFLLTTKKELATN
jgi:hypothetical protein